MSIALSRTGISTLRMQAAAQALLTPGFDKNHSAVFDMASSVCQFQRDSDQITHALRFVAELKQAVSLMAPDLRSCLRTRLLEVYQRANELMLGIPATDIGDWTPTGRLILTTRFLDRPLVCALEPVGSAGTDDRMDLTLFRLVMPAWMLLADQREIVRVTPTGCRVLTPWGEAAEVIDLAEGGLALTLAAPPPLPIQGGVGWSGLLLHADAQAAIPLYLKTVNVRLAGHASMRLGARLHVTGTDARLRLRRLIRCHVDLFGELQTVQNRMDDQTQTDFPSPGVLGAVSPAPTFSMR